MKLRRTYNDKLLAPGRPVATYEIVEDGEVVGHLCKYEETYRELKKFKGVSRPVGTGRTSKSVHWRYRIFGRPESRLFHLKRDAVTAYRADRAGV